MTFLCFKIFDVCFCLFQFLFNIQSSAIWESTPLIACRFIAQIWFVFLIMGASSNQKVWLMAKLLFSLPREPNAYTSLYSHQMVWRLGKVICTIPESNCWRLSFKMSWRTFLNVCRQKNLLNKEISFLPDLPKTKILINKETNSIPDLLVDTVWLISFFGFFCR